MIKLIAILVAAMPVILFLRTVFFKQSKVMKEASSAFRRQVDYLMWGHPVPGRVRARLFGRNTDPFDLEVTHTYLPTMAWARAITAGGAA